MPTAECGDGTPGGQRSWRWRADPGSGRLELCTALRAHLGIAATDPAAQARELLRRLHPEDRRRLLRFLRSEAWRDGPGFRQEIRVRAAGGRLHWFAVAGAAEPDDGEPGCLAGTAAELDETRLVADERDLLFNLSLDLLGIAGLDGYLRQLNPAWVRILGWSRDDLMARPVLEIVHPEDRERVEAAMVELAAGRPVQDLEVRFAARDGSHRWLSFSNFPLPDRNVVFSVARDVTEHRAVEERLQQYQDRLRRLSLQLTRVEERQRRDLATALHDGLAQDLFAIRTQAGLLQRIERLDDPQAVVRSIIGGLDGAMEKTRSLTFELLPPSLHEVGLEAALEWLISSCGERWRLECRFTEAGPEVELAGDERSMLYQIVRELLANVHRHAAAETVTVAVERRPGRWRVTVEDDGAGFVVDASGERPVSEPSLEGGFGLFSIRERLRSHGGRMQVDSAPGRGCRVMVEIPTATASAVEPD
ncbi:MAG: PAS domain-containing sensor histidine kinase [Candidatus Krumholzibacteriia bacterium]